MLPKYSNHYSPMISSAISMNNIRIIPKLNGKNPVKRSWVSISLQKWDKTNEKFDMGRGVDEYELPDYLYKDPEDQFPLKKNFWKCPYGVPSKTSGGRKE